MSTRQFKRFSIVLLTALVVTVVEVNLNAVKEATSPIESFWYSIPTQYKTKLKVYDEKGRLAYVIELVLANETTLGQERVNIVPFIAGVEPEKIPHSAFFLYYIYKPEETTAGRRFALSDLIITIPNEPHKRPEKIYISDHEVAGYLIRQAGNLDYPISVYESMTGVLILERGDKNLLKHVKDEGKKVFVYYKGGGPRVELKLPGEI